MGYSPSRSLISFHDPLLPRIDSRLRPVTEVKLAQDIADVSLDRVFTDHQLFSNLIVRQGIGNEPLPDLYSRFTPASSHKITLGSWSAA